MSERRSPPRRHTARRSCAVSRGISLAAAVALAVACGSGGDTVGHAASPDHARLERNKQVVLRYVAAFNAGDVDTLRALFAPGATIQGVLKEGGMVEILPVWAMLHESLAIELTVEEMIAEGDRVAVRYRERGTFRAPFLGHEPTGRSFELVAMEWFVVRDGLIHARWGARDAASQARQIGIPPG